jgi:Ca2+-binding RTX toxin-like protein
MATITGTSGNEYLLGTADADTIEGRGGNDTLVGGAGADTLRGGLGNYEMYGGDGNDDFGDNLEQGSSAVTLRGGAGDDVFWVSFGGSRLIDGGSGNDTAILFPGDTVLVGPGTGHDSLLLAFQQGVFVRFHGSRFTSFADVLTAAVEEEREDGSFATVIQIDESTSVRLVSMAKESLEGRSFQFDATPLTLDPAPPPPPRKPGIYNGTAGDDTILGSTGTDTLNGQAGNDFIDGEGGSDLVDAGAGDDTIVVAPGYGNMRMADGGSGDDTVRVNAALQEVAWVRDVDGTRELRLADGTIVFENRASGASFNLLQAMDHESVRFVVGLAAAERLEGGAGDDVVYANGGADTVVGAAGNDYLAAGVDDATDDSYEGGEGTDTLSYSGATGGGVSVYLDAGVALGPGIGTDRFTGIEIAVGSADHDVLIGRASAANDLRGHWGNDWLYGYAGNDALAGGEGVDVMVAGEGNDTLDGGGAQDWMYGNGGSNVLRGDAGVDVLISQGTNDTLAGGEDGDYLYAYGEGLTVAAGDGGNDIFVMQSGPSLAAGGEGQDYFYMGTFSDTMTGGAGVDVMLGGGGNDLYDGGAGTDYLFLGAGSSVVLFREGSGADVIQGFKDHGTQHAIRFEGTRLRSFEDLFAATYDFEGNALIQIDYETVVWLVGVSKAQLTTADFAIA